MAEPTEVQQKVAELEKAEGELTAKRAAIDASNVEIAEKEKQKAALQAESERIQVELAKARELKRQAETRDTTFQEKFRSEQLQKAKDRFFSEYGYDKPEDQAKVIETFKRFDSGSVDADNIYNDLVTTHVVLNKSSYVALEKKAKAVSGGVQKFLESQSSMASAGAGQGTQEQNIEMTDDDLRAAQMVGMPVDTYRDLKKKYPWMQ